MTRRNLGWLVLGVLVMGAGSAQGQLISAPGRVALELSDDRGPTVLGADLQALDSLLCGGPTVRMPGGGEDCRLVAGDKRLGDPNAVEVSVAPSSLGSAMLDVHATSAYLYGELVTSCGGWNWELTLDPARRQPSSAIDFLALGGDPASGTTRGVLVLIARIDFEHSGTGDQVTVPWRVELDFLSRYHFSRWPAVDGTDLDLFTDGGSVERTECLSERTTRCGRWCLKKSVTVGPS